MFDCGTSSSVSVLDCTAILRAAWASVPAKLIRNCFEMCNIQITNAAEHMEATVLEDTDSELRNLWQEGKAAGWIRHFSVVLRTIFSGIVPDELSFDEFVTADDGLPTESSKFELRTITEQETSEEEIEEEEDVDEEV